MLDIMQSVPPPTQDPVTIPGHGHLLPGLPGHGPEHSVLAPGHSQVCWLFVHCIDIILRMLIALGLSVCRPASGAIIAEIFSPAARGVANGGYSQ